MDNVQQKTDKKTETDNQISLSTRQLEIILGIVFVAVIIILSVDWVSERRLTTVYVVVPLVFIILVSYLFLQRNIRQPAQVVVPLAALIGINYILITGGGIHDTSLISYVAVLLIANLTLSGNASFLFGGAVVLSVITIGLLEINHIIVNKFSHITDYADVVIIPVIIMAIAGLQRLLVGRLTKSIQIAQQNEQRQIEANAELRSLQASLEERIAERTNELEEANQRNKQRAQQFEAITLVGNAISSIRSLDELLPKITELISQEFGLYHAGIFLNDANNEYAVLSAANSEGGRRMLQRGHRLKIGKQGIVGYATSTGKPHIALDVGEDAVYFDNPYMPATRSEMALPLKISGAIIGALDVQSTEEAAFSEEDFSTLSLLADQVSLAIENARLFDQARKSLAESEALYRQYIRQAWNRLPKEQDLIGFRYTAKGAIPIKTEGDASNLARLAPGVDKESTREETPRISIPISIRGETIGTLSVRVPQAESLKKDQMDLVNAVAERVALSAENARLFEETTRRAERERMVSDITVKIRSTNDPDAMIKTALNELKTALGATHVELIPHTLQKATTVEQAGREVKKTKKSKKKGDEK